MSRGARLSVITVCRNSADTLARTIESVLSQQAEGIEYLIIDGASTDGTWELVQKYQKQLALFLSEPDRGLYHAMNKGWQRATGQYIAYLNADDYYAHPQVLTRVLETLEASGTEALYGDLELRSPGQSWSRHWVSGKETRLRYHLGWMPPHPATFVTRSLFERLGGFREDLKIAADYELMLRYFYKNRVRLTYLPEELVIMQAGGRSNAGIGAVVQGNWEVYRSWALNELPRWPLVSILKPLSKLAQFQLTR